MTKRLFMGMALAMFASLALPTVSQAGSILYDATGFVTVLTNAATDATVQFNQVVTGPVTILPGTNLSAVGVTGIGTSTLTFTFASAPSPKTYDLDFSVYSTAGLVFQGGAVSGTPLPMGGVVGSVVPASVPEPASLALLGIGMTGFLAFRRFFKKTSVA